MRILYLTALLACFSLTACKKTNKFIVNGISDIDATRDTTVIIPLDIEHEEGEQEKVTLSLSGLPQHVTHKFSSENGTPGFSSSLTINVLPEAAPGNYPLKIKAASSSGNSKEYEMTLKINNVKSCRVAMVGEYVRSTSGICPGSGNVIVEYHPTEKNKVLMKNLFGYGETETAVVDCNGKTFVVPTPTVQDANVLAANFTDNRIFFRYNTAFSSCAITLTKK